MEMKLNRTYLKIIFSSLGLIILLIIQVNWLLNTAQVKEELFREKASIVMSRTVEELCADKETCETMSRCCMLDNNTDCKVKIGKAESSKIDSLLKHYMRYYNFRIDYSFEINQAGNDEIVNDGWEKNALKKRLEEAASNLGLELKLIFPDRNKFIFEEMGVMFISSIFLIVIVMILFISTTRSLLREKRLSAYTTEFINNMTHEIKTPLTNISLAGKMIVKNAEEANTDKIKYYSGIIQDEKDKLEFQVEQLLHLAELERGEIPLKSHEINIQDLLRQSAKTFSLQVEQKQGSLLLDLQAAKYNVLGDKVHLMNAIGNLIENAVKYNVEHPEIIIKTLNTADDIVISIMDNGPGISKEFHHKIFEKYFRIPTGDVHNVKGFGVGLAYVKKIVELHKGSISLESELGKGANFIIKLPLHDKSGN